MPSSIILNAQTVPGDSIMPPTPQQLINFVASYLALSGFQNLDYIIIGETPPGPDYQNNAWFQVSSSGLPIGLYIYNGGWIPLPIVIPSGPTEPVTPTIGQMFYNLTTNTLEIFAQSGQWTNNVYPSGITSARPATPPLGFLFYDTTVGALLRYTSQGWSTFDGIVGELKAVAGVPIANVSVNFPGWAIFGPLQGAMPLGADGVTFNPGQTGGRTIIPWTTKSNSVASGTPGPTGLVNCITIDSGALGTTTDGIDNSTDQQAGVAVASSFDITNPYCAVVWIQKMY